MCTRKWVPVVVLAALFVVSGVLLSGAGGRGRGPAASRPVAPRTPQIGSPWNRLNLTDDQKQTYLALQAKVTEIDDRIRALQVERKVAEKAIEEGMMPVLTEAQKAVLAVLKPAAAKPRTP